MTDLCHNCGDSHLGAHPTPCKQGVNECSICKNWGHTFIFCPLSVRLTIKDYQYWMLCHNCDRWHLPRACDHALVTCPRCHNLGHLATFCPLYPLARDQPLGDTTAVKRENLRVPLVLDINMVHPDLIHQIKMEALGQAPQLPAMLSYGAPATQNGQFQQRGPAMSPYGNSFGTSTYGGNSYSSRPTQYDRPQAHLTELRSLPTPVPSSALKPSVASNAGHGEVENTVLNTTELGQEMSNNAGQFVAPDAPAIPADQNNKSNDQAHLHDPYQGYTQQVQNLPPIREAIVGYNGNIHAHAHADPFLDDSDMHLHRSLSAALGHPETFLSAQAQSRRSGDVFAFDGNGKVDGHQSRQQSMAAMPIAESPSQEIQYELPSPMVPDEQEPSAAKPKKAAAKKKGAGRKKKT